MKRWISLCLLLVPLLASAASFWDGNAALQRGDATFEGGMFAASNSFPQDTQISIENLDSGKTATATITKQIDGQPDILVLLSPMTASALGISQGTLARVRVTITARTPSAPAAVQRRADDQHGSRPQPRSRVWQCEPRGLQSDQPCPADRSLCRGSCGHHNRARDTACQHFSGDDAGSTGESDAKHRGHDAAGRPSTSSPEETSLPPAEVPGTTTPAPQLPLGAPEAPPAAQQQTTGQTAQAQTQPAVDAAAAQAAADAENAAIVAAAESRVPQKQVFQPPREDSKFAYKKPPETPTQAAAATTPQTAQAAGTTTAPQGPPQITSVDGEPGVVPAAPKQEQIALPDAIAPEESQPVEIVSTTPTSAPTPGQAPATVALAAPEPIAETPAPAATTPAQTDVTDEPATPPPPAAAPDVALTEPIAPEESQPVEIVGTDIPSAPAGTSTAVALAAPEVAPEEQAPVTAEPVQTDVTGPSVAPPAVQSPRLALVAPEVPPIEGPAAAAVTAPPAAATAATAATAPATTTAAAAAATVPATTVASAAAVPPVIASLPSGGKSDVYFLQLGAYAGEQMARDLAAKLAATYPTVVLSPAGTGTQIFKVMIGPLNRAESGTLLTWFRFRGFPDAFLRQE